VPCSFRYRQVRLRYLQVAPFLARSTTFYGYAGAVDALHYGRDFRGLMGCAHIWRAMRLPPNNPAGGAV
jgi:hypothetical protein